MSWEYMTRSEDKSMKSHRKEDVFGFANMSPDGMKALKLLESELSVKEGKRIVLVAYENKEVLQHVRAEAE